MDGWMVNNIINICYNDIILYSYFYDNFAINIQLLTMALLF